MSEYITIEETLKSSDIDTALRSAVVSEEIIEAVREQIIYAPLCSEQSLEGKTGRKLVFPKATSLSATNITSVADNYTEPEDTLSSNYSATDKTITNLTVHVTKLVYAAIEMTDILSEDYPSIDWVRLHMANMASAIAEELESEIYDLWVSGSGLTKSVASISYDGIVEAKAQFENAKWMFDMKVTPFLIISPDAKAVLLKDTTFVSTERYTTSELANMVNGEAGKYAGCRVLVSPRLDGTGYAFLKYPEKVLGTVSLILWKRAVRVRSQREEKDETTFMVTSARWGLGIVQSAGILRFDIADSP